MIAITITTITWSHVLTEGFCNSIKPKIAAHTKASIPLTNKLSKIILIPRMNNTPQEATQAVL
jgi:hypothetical protein